MKTMILVWGSSNRGKSQSIKRLAESMPFTSIIRLWNNNDYDSYVIGTIRDMYGKDRIVGIESQGDPGYEQENWINACISADCEIIVAASRSYGKTYVDAIRLAKDNGYAVIELTTFFHENTPILPSGVDLRDVFAESMISLVTKCLV